MGASIASMRYARSMTLQTIVIWNRLRDRGNFGENFVRDDHFGHIIEKAYDFQFSSFHASEPFYKIPLLPLTPPKKPICYFTRPERIFLQSLALHVVSLSSFGPSRKRQNLLENYVMHGACSSWAQKQFP